MFGGKTEGEGQQTFDSGHLSPAGTRTHTLFSSDRLRTTSVMALTAVQGGRSVAIDPITWGSCGRPSQREHFTDFLDLRGRRETEQSRSVELCHPQLFTTTLFFSSLTQPIYILQTPSTSPFPLFSLDFGDAFSLVCGSFLNLEPHLESVFLCKQRLVLCISAPGVQRDSS